MFNFELAKYNEPFSVVVDVGSSSSCCVHVIRVDNAITIKVR